MASTVTPQPNDMGKKVDIKKLDLKDVQSGYGVPVTSVPVPPAAPSQAGVGATTSTNIGDGSKGTSISTGMRNISGRVCK